MSEPSPTPRRIAVIGGGIAGLAAAHRLVELDPRCELTLFEAGPRLGGVLSTVHEDGFQVEQSADNFITTVPWGVDLCKRLGLGDQLLRTNPAYRRTFVVRRGRLHRLPDGFLMMAPTRLWPLARDADPQSAGQAPRGAGILHSAAAGRRRREHGRVRPPPLGPRGVRAAGRAAGQRGLRRRSGKAQRAGHAFALPRDGARFRQPDPRDAASDARIVRSRSSESGARYSMFVTLRDGLSSLVAAIASRLPPGAVRLNTPVTSIERRGDQWRVWTEQRRRRRNGEARRQSPQSPELSPSLSLPPSTP